MKKSASSEELTLPSGGSDRRRSGDLSIFSRTLYQLSYRALGDNVTMIAGISSSNQSDPDGT
jgi:hypothetical protein